MFRSARIRLTAWYILIILWISMLFSTIIYTMVSRQIEGFIERQNERASRMQQGSFELNNRPPFGKLPFIDTEELLAQKKELLGKLILVNLGIVFLVGGASYFLSGKTLRPIKQMLDEQNQFITDSSHELRTPIATMRAEMEQHLLEKKLTDKDARKLIASNLEELSSLQQLTDNLLQLSHIDSIDRENTVENVGVNDIVTQAQKKTAALAKAKAIEIHAEGENIRINGNKQSLIDVIVILLDNAIKYSQKNTAIRISTKQSDTMARIAVQDEGIGVAPKDIPHIFDRFYRADSSRSTVEGYGLGLSIAKKIVTAHNGTIEAKRNKGNGMTFTVCLPSVS